MRTKDIEPVMKAVAEVVRGYVDKQLQPIRDRIAHLEASAPAKAWQPGTTYTRGSIVEHACQRWVASAAETRAAPGTGSGWSPM